MSLKHNKKRSTGIVYELLIRKISESLVHGDKRSAATAMGMIKKYFSPKTPIGAELEAIDVLRRTRGTDRNFANRVLREVEKVASKLDRRLIEVKKSNLIKEINYTFGKDFFSDYKLPDYRALASMQVFVESFSKNQTLSENVERAKIEEALVVYMCSPVVSEGSEFDPNRNVVSYSLALKKFEKKYGGALNKRQRGLLESYVSGLFSGDFKKFKEQAAKDKETAYKTIVSAMKMDECRSDKVLLERLNEAALKLKTSSISTNEAFVSDMMLYHDLCEEIESDDE